MTIKEIKNGLLDQARDKEALANHDNTSIFAHDAQVLKEAAKHIEELEGRITAIEAKASKLVNVTRCKDRIGGTMNEDLISRAAVIKMLREKAESYKPSMFTTESECYIAKIVAIEAAQEVSHMAGVSSKSLRNKKIKQVGRCLNYYREQAQKTRQALYNIVAQHGFPCEECKYYNYTQDECEPSNNNCMICTADCPCSRCSEYNEFVYEFDEKPIVK